MFQTSVKRNYTVGFPGEIVRDGPLRAQMFRLVAQATPQLIANARNAGNVMARAFGWAGEVKQPGSTLAMLAPTAVVGGPIYAGVLINPKHYVLQGTPTGGTLAPSLKLNDGTEAELATMAIIVAELINISTSTVNIDASFQIGYVNNTVTDATEPLGLPFGALFAIAGDAVPPVGTTIIQNARVLNPITLAPSAVGALVAGLTIVALTQ